MDPRQVEDPLQSLFSLSDDVYRLARWSITRIYITIIFIIFSLFFTGLLFLLWLSQGNALLALLGVGLLLAGLMGLHMVIRILGLFRTIVVKHAAIHAVRSDPIFRIPRGDTPEERFINYLRERSREFSALLKRCPEALHMPGTISGARGNHTFHAYVLKRAFLPWKSYLLLIRRYENMPGMAELRRYLAEVEDVWRKWKILPSRMVMLVPEGEIPDEVYEKATSGVKIGGKDVVLQIVMETEDGTYDLIPIIPELPGFLP